MGRVAVFIYPLFVIGCCFLVEEIEKKAYKIFGAAVLFLTATIFFFHTCFSLNTNWYNEWRYGTITDAKKLLSNINQIKTETRNPINLGASFGYEPTINFYRETLPLANIDEIDIQGIKYENDYFLVNEEDFNRIPPQEAEIMEYNKEVKSYLLKHTPNFKLHSNIKANNQKFLSADLNNENVIIANRDEIGLWGTFSIIKYDNNMCAIVSFNYYFLSAELDHKNKITATRTKAGPWELFTLIELEEGFVAFKAANGKYLTVDEKTLQVFANADEIGENEKFEIIMSHL